MHSGKAPTSAAGHDGITVAVRFVADRLGLAEQMLAEHAVDESGPCWRCRYRLLPERWPCTAARTAQLAVESIAAVNAAKHTSIVAGGMQP